VKEKHDNIDDEGQGNRSGWRRVKWATKMKASVLGTIVGDGNKDEVECGVWMIFFWVNIVVKGD